MQNKDRNLIVFEIDVTKKMARDLGVPNSSPTNFTI